MYEQHGLKVNVGLHSEKGLKAQNEDAVGYHIPREPVLTTKGMVALIADGVSSAEAGKEASETCVHNFISDYFSTPESWSVKTSAQRILTALNRWLYGQGLSYLEADKGYISTLSVLVIKSRRAHLFHIGDSRIYLLRDGDLEPLTKDHSTRVSKDSCYLTRAMGMDLMLDVDYVSIDLLPGDRFLMTTDGVHDFLSRTAMRQMISDSEASLTTLCADLASRSLEQGSDDNITAMLVDIESLSEPNADDVHQTLCTLPFPPPLEVGMVVDGLRVLDEIHASKRSQVYRVEDVESGAHYAMKTPSVNFEDDLVYIERFVLEPWIGSRIDSPHVVKVPKDLQRPSFLYYLCEYREGSTLAQWMQNQKNLPIDRVIAIVKQLVAGVRAMHRKETLHQDIKPENIMIDVQDQVCLIDFGSCYVAGISEIDMPFERDQVLGTESYGAPEYKMGRRSSLKSDLFSIAVVTYEMLTGHHPYGEAFENCRAAKDFYRLHYVPAREFNPMVPVWMDGALGKALNISPELRHDALSEFVYDLEHPNKDFLKQDFVPLAQRNPLRFWQGVSGALLLALVVSWYLMLR